MKLPTPIFALLVLPATSSEAPERRNPNTDREQIDGTIGPDFLTGCEAVTVDHERMFVRTR